MPVNRVFAVLWDIFQPLLFGLIGAEIDVNKIEGKTIGETRRAVRMRALKACDTSPCTSRRGGALMTS